jgi:aerobic C4-dicarboxylate transport protein
LELRRSRRSAAIPVPDLVAEQTDGNASNDWTTGVVAALLYLSLTTLRTTGAGACNHRATPDRWPKIVRQLFRKHISASEVLALYVFGGMRELPRQLIRRVPAMYPQPKLQQETTMLTSTSGIDAPVLPAARRWYKQLWVQVLIAMAFGIAIGHYFPDAGVSLQPLGDGFIKLIRMLIAPIIFCTVILGIAKMDDMSRVGRVAIKGLIYFEVMTTIALVVGLVVVNLWQPGVGMNVNASNLDTNSIKAYVAQSHDHGIVAFLLNIIPTTLVGSLAEGNILQVLLISVILGSALIQLGDYGKPIVNLLDVFSKVLFGAVAIVMWAAPLGAFGAIAFTVGKYGAGALLSLGNLLICFYVTCLIFIFAILGPIARLSGFSLFKLMRFLREEILVCLATTSSESVLPRMLIKMEQLGCKPSIVGLIIPTGYSFNLDGTCLYLASVTVFLAQATNTPLDLYQQIVLLSVLLLTSKGAAGVAGAAFVVLAATLSTVGSIPVASVALILGVHRLLSEGLTPTNLIGNAVATIVISKWEKGLDVDKMHRVLNRE